MVFFFGKEKQTVNELGEKLGKTIIFSITSLDHLTKFLYFIVYCKLYY